RGIFGCRQHRMNWNRPQGSDRRGLRPLARRRCRSRADRTAPSGPGGRGSFDRPYFKSPSVSKADNMASPISRLATRIAYGATQLPRVAWYVGHGEIMRRLSDQARQRSESVRAKPHTDRFVPDRRRLFADVAKLFQQDLANVEAGIYPLPADHDGSWLKLVHHSRLFLLEYPYSHPRPECGQP